MKATSTAARLPNSQPLRAQGSERRDGTGPGQHEPAALIFCVSAWLAGLLACAIRATRQLAALASLRRRAVPVGDSEWHTALAQARACSGFWRPIALLASDELDVPCVTGMVHHAIIVPSASSEWSVAEKHSVMTHEIAHVVRSDLTGRYLSMLVCALHWFNPIVWWLGSRMERDAELATDALVVRFGIRPSVYADALLSLGERVAPPMLRQFALSFASRLSITSRVLAILEPLPPAEARRGTRWSLAAVSFIAATGVGEVRLVPRSPGLGADERVSIQQAVTKTPARQPRRAEPRTTARAAEIAGTDWISEAVIGLITTLRDTNPHVRLAAAEALGEFGTTMSIAALEQATGDSDPAVRNAATRALSSSRPGH